MIKVPLVLSGLYLPNVNNPILLAWAYAEAELIYEEPSGVSEFLSMFWEASGFECKPLVNLRGPLPKLSRYIVLSLEIVKRAREECGLPIKEKEIWEMLELLDGALMDSPYVEGLRKVQRYQSPYSTEREKILCQSMSVFTK